MWPTSHLTIVSLFGAVYLGFSECNIDGYWHDNQNYQIKQEGSDVRFESANVRAWKPTIGGRTGSKLTVKFNHKPVEGQISSECDFIQWDNGGQWMKGPLDETKPKKVGKALRCGMCILLSNDLWNTLELETQDYTEPKSEDAIITDVEELCGGSWIPAFSVQNTPIERGDGRWAVQRDASKKEIGEFRYDWRAKAMMKACSDVITEQSVEIAEILYTQHAKQVQGQPYLELSSISHEICKAHCTSDEEIYGSVIQVGVQGQNYSANEDAPPSPSDDGENIGYEDEDEDDTIHEL